MKCVFLHLVFYVAEDLPLCSMWNNVLNAWWPLIFYPATDAPRFTKGMWAMIGTAIATLLVTAMVYILEKREKRQKVAARGMEEEVDEKKSKEYETSLQG